MWVRLTYTVTKYGALIRGHSSSSNWDVWPNIGALGVGDKVRDQGETAVKKEVIRLSLHSLSSRCVLHLGVKPGTFLGRDTSRLCSLTAGLVCWPRAKVTCKSEAPDQRHHISKNTSPLRGGETQSPIYLPGCIFGLFTFFYRSLMRRWKPLF